MPIRPDKRARAPVSAAGDGSPASELRRSGAVVDRFAEDAAVEERAAEPEVEVELPGEADAAVQLGGVAGDAVVEVAHVRLDHGGVAGRLVLDAVEGVRRVPHQGERGLE